MIRKDGVSVARGSISVELGGLETPDARSLYTLFFCISCTFIQEFDPSIDHRDGSQHTSTTPTTKYNGKIITFQN